MKGCLRELVQLAIIIVVAFAIGYFVIDNPPGFVADMLPKRDCTFCNGTGFRKQFNAFDSGANSGHRSSNVTKDKCVHCKGRGKVIKMPSVKPIWLMGLLFYGIWKQCTKKKKDGSS